eukprot:jgi/Mesvir1/13041/Mv06032-RA.1
MTVQNCCSATVLSVWALPAGTTLVVTVTLGLAGWAIHRAFSVQQESLFFLNGVGVQLETKYLLGSPTKRMYSLDKVRGVVINEAVQAFGCHFYLALLVDGEDEMVVPFPRTRLRLAQLKVVYGDLRDLLARQHGTT